MRKEIDFERLYKEVLSEQNKCCNENDSISYYNKRKILRDKQSLEIRQLTQKHQLQLLNLRRKQSNKLNSIRKKHQQQLRDLSSQTL